MRFFALATLNFIGPNDCHAECYNPLPFANNPKTILTVGGQSIDFRVSMVICGRSDLWSEEAHQSSANILRV